MLLLDCPCLLLLFLLWVSQNFEVASVPPFAEIGSFRWELMEALLSPCAAREVCVMNVWAVVIKLHFSHAESHARGFTHVTGQEGWVQAGQPWSLPPTAGCIDGASGNYWAKGRLYKYRASPERTIEKRLICVDEQIDFAAAFNSTNLNFVLTRVNMSDLC